MNQNTNLALEWCHSWYTLAKNVRVGAAEVGMADNRVQQRHGMMKVGGRGARG